jgi:hypothetical protein
MAGHRGRAGETSRPEGWFGPHDDRFEHTVPLPRTEI